MSRTHSSSNPHSTPAPHTPAPRSAPARRTLLLAASAAGLTAGAAGLSGALGAWGSPPRTPAAGPAAAPVPATRLSSRPSPPAPLAPYTEGTTLDSVATPRGGPGGYRRLAEGPGWQRLVREDLVTAHAGRQERRRTLAALVQFTDLHLVDVQHPLRYEYLRAATASAWRPQEALSVVGALALVERVNGLRGAPATGAPLDLVMTTGDNTDNNAACELDWFLGLMSGGQVTPDTGLRGHFEGVQSAGIDLYWQPGERRADADKRHGFPYLPGYLAAATRPLHSPGLNLPWYSTVGNHDFLPGGCWAPGDGWAHEIATGDRKLMSLPAGTGAGFWRKVTAGQDPKGDLFRTLLHEQRRRTRRVTPDPRRAPVTPEQYLRAHLDPRHTGPGPHGHGYTENSLDRRVRYYAFPIGDDVLGISLDTTDLGGHYEGSLDETQFRWLERTLARAEQPYALVFSHHTSATMRNTRPDPARPGERRRDGAAVRALLSRSPRVLAWINGHSHKNAITPHPGFWEISTASHIDHPQLARVVELTANGDGTLSLFTTLVESDAPATTDFTDLGPRGLASLYRELALNAPGARTTLAGRPSDRNTELLLPTR
ncbi:TIGR03767 family metallophosphoesterase [Streptomyces sp. DT18]